MGIGDIVRTLFGPVAGSERLSGPPPSANGASSHHLFWRVPALDERIVEVSVEIEVIEPPTVDRLYFWALQTSFAEHGVVTGAGHLGLQFHPAYPDAGAVNWGGYYSPASGRSGELPGSPLAAISALDNPNTCNYRWEPHRVYRYRIAHAEASTWVGSVTDVERNEELEIRRLYCLGDAVQDVVMWTEAFADCDDPPTAVRWSSPQVTTASGERIEPSGFAVNYQTVADGGCSTSNSESDGAAVVQRTGVVRTTPPGSLLGR